MQVLHLTRVFVALLATVVLLSAALLAQSLPAGAVLHDAALEHQRNLRVMGTIEMEFMACDKNSYRKGAAVAAPQDGPVFTVTTG